MNPLRVVVVGAGIVGAWLSKSLAERGAEVTLVEAGAPGGGATQASFAWINASTKKDPGYFDLNVRGMQAWREVDRLQPGAAGYVRCGSYEWAADATGAQQIAERVARLNAWGYHARDVGPMEIAAHHPGIDVADMVGAAGSYPDEAIVDPIAGVANALARLRDAGGRFQPWTPVRAVLTEGDTAVGVETATGDRLLADAVVLAAGIGNQALCRPLGVDSGLEEASAPSVPGATLHATVAGDGPGVAAVLHTPGINLRPGTDLSVILHADDIDQVGSDEASLARATGELARRAEARLGRKVAAGQLRASNRVMPRDGRSIVGWAEGVHALYLLMTHSGVTLAPALATSAALELTSGADDSQLAPFRPERFTTTGHHGAP